MPVTTIAVPVQPAGSSHKGRVIAEAVSTPAGNYFRCQLSTRLVLRNTTASPIVVSFFADTYGAEIVLDQVTVPANSVNGGRVHLGPFSSDFFNHRVTDASKSDGVMFGHAAAAGAIVIDAYEEK